MQVLTKDWTDLDPIVDEATAVTSWPQMRVFLSAGHLDAPHRLPGLIELTVNWINPRVVWSHCIAHICGNAMVLEREQRIERRQDDGKCGGQESKNKQARMQISNTREGC